MPDVIPPDDRRLIDEAVARGRVTVCPPRTCTLEIDKAVPLREQITTAFNAGKAKKARGRPRRDSVAEKSRVARR